MNNFRTPQDLKALGLDAGAAGINLRLSNGNITVYHGSDSNLVLAELKNAPDGTWNRIWEHLDRLGFKRNEDLG